MAENKNYGLTDEEVLQATEILKKLPTGYQPQPIYEQIARLRTLPYVELAVFNDDASQILLTQRLPYDTFWPNQWHIPGVNLNATVEKAESYQEAVTRLLQKEFGGLSVTPPMLMNQEPIARISHRGPEAVSVYLAYALGKPSAGKFYGLGDLPPNTVEYHIPLIRRAAEAIKKA